jgi:hypothetical protein
MFGFFAITLPSGLSVYWIASNIISMVMQYRVTGWGTLRMPSLPFLKKEQPQPADPANVKTASVGGKKAGEGEPKQQKQPGGKGSGTERKEAVKGDVTSQQGKVRHGKHRGKRKN